MANKIVREKVVAFRLTDEQYKAFKEKIVAEQVIGAKSPGLMTRKLVLDWMAGQLICRSKKKRTLAPEVATAPLEPSAVPA
jgi:hypothetical protein